MLASLMQSCETMKTQASSKQETMTQLCYCTNSLMPASCLSQADKVTDTRDFKTHGSVNLEVPPHPLNDLTHPLDVSSKESICSVPPGRRNKQQEGT